MIRWMIMGLLFFLSQVVFAHDLNLTIIRYDKTTHQIELKTPLSRLVKIANLGTSPSPTQLDLAIRSRLGVAANPSSSLKTESDLLIWSGSIDLGAEKHLQRFDQSTRYARTILMIFEGSSFISESVLGAEKPQSSTAGMLNAGIQHILTGLDHILFVVGLALLGKNPKSILKFLTAFTLAHTITLSLATLGYLQLNPRIVEPLIALSIVLLAVEGLRSKTEPTLKQGIAIAFGFGLFHGLGFASGLDHLGIQGNLLVRNLLSFSIGIEAGQMLILLPCLLLLSLAAKLKQETATRFTTFASVALGMIGCFWFMERLL